jgi:hypothetical protein
MKPYSPDTTASSPRRRWLGAVAAAAGAAWAWRARAPRAALPTGKPILADRTPVGAVNASTPIRLGRIVVRPSSESVKRHG